jgi:hypothetical protein
MNLIKSQLPHQQPSSTQESIKEKSKAPSDRNRGQKMNIIRQNQGGVHAVSGKTQSHYLTASSQILNNMNQNQRQMLLIQQQNTMSIMQQPSTNESTKNLQKKK